MRDRLVELLEEADVKVGEYIRENDHMDFVPTRAELHGVEADHLLANGVIVPPCKVKDTVYMVSSGGKIHEKKVLGVTTTVGLSLYDEIRTSAIFLCEGALIFKDSDIGKTVFLTREEAEQALKGEHNG